MHSNYTQESKGRIMLRLNKNLGRAALLFLDVACGLTMVAACWLVLARPAQAYVDPSVMTYTIQALAGVAVALSAVIGVAFRRTRKVLMKAFKIDENSNKIVEPRVSRIDSSLASAADERIKSDFLPRLNKRMGGGPNDGEKLAWKSRIIASFIIVSACVFTLFFVAPLELVGGNGDSLVYGLKDVLPLFILPTILMCVIGALVVSLFRGRVFHVVLMLTFGVVLASYCQCLFLNVGLPTADGTAIDWTSLTKRAVLSTAVWVVLAVLPLVLSYLSKKRARLIACAASLLLILVQAVSVGSVIASSGTASGASVSSLTEDGMLTVSSKKNVIVFVLDQYDNVIDLMSAIKDNPDLLDEMSGFTWFQNATAVITPTREAIPYMLNSKELPHEHTEGESIYDESENGTAYLQEVKDAGYSVGVYDDLINPDADYLKGVAFNDVDRADIDVLANVDRKGLYKTLISCGLLRDLPWAFKPFFWFYTDDINQAMTKKNENSTYDPKDTVYSTNDAGFAAKLRKHGLTTEDEGESGAFRFIHLNGAHDPYVMNENEQPDASASREQQAVGAMNIVSDYICQLKDLGLYDDATIIITADHGRHSYYNTGNLADPYASLDETSVPIMLVKPSASSAGAYSVSDMPVSTDDVMPTVAQAVGVSVSDGDESVFDVDDPNRVRYFYQLSKDENGEHGVVEYRVVGNANDLSNWTRTGWVRRYPEMDWAVIPE